MRLRRRRRGEQVESSHTRPRDGAVARVGRAAGRVARQVAAPLERPFTGSRPPPARARTLGPAHAQRGRHDDLGRAADQVPRRAVLHAGPRAMLGGLTAARPSRGLLGWQRESSHRVDKPPSPCSCSGRRSPSARAAPCWGSGWRGWSICTCRVELALLLFWVGNAELDTADGGTIAASIEQGRWLSATASGCSPCIRCAAAATLPRPRRGRPVVAEADVLGRVARDRYPATCWQVSRTDREGLLAATPTAEREIRRDGGRLVLGCPAPVSTARPRRTPSTCGGSAS